MSTQPPTALTIPYLQQVKDAPTAGALRFLGDQIGKLTRGGFTGTLSPDQKPNNLTQKDAGTEFFSTDFARGYKWTGIAWVDLPDAPSRFTTSLFAQAPEPPIGWALCDGRSVPRSTSSGGVSQFTTPNLPPNTGLRYWVRI